MEYSTILGTMPWHLRQEAKHLAQKYMSPYLGSLNPKTSFMKDPMET